MTRPDRWYGVEVNHPEQAPRVVSIRARTGEAAERRAEIDHPDYTARTSWRLQVTSRHEPSTRRTP